MHPLFPYIYASFEIKLLKLDWMHLDLLPGAWISEIGRYEAFKTPWILSPGWEREEREREKEREREREIIIYIYTCQFPIFNHIKSQFLIILGVSWGHGVSGILYFQSPRYASPSHRSSRSSEDCSAFWAAFCDLARRLGECQLGLETGGAPTILNLYNLLQSL